MEQIEVTVPPKGDLSGAEEKIEWLCASKGLWVSVKGTLSEYPGSVHWHFKKGKERGTLELTLWKASRRIWISVHAGRTGAWTGETLADLKTTLERELG